MDIQWHHLQARLQRYLRRFLRRPEDAEDVAQEALVRVLEAGSKGEIHYQRAYLYRTARNLAFNLLARKSHQLEDYLEDHSDAESLSASIPLEDEVASQRRFELFCRTAATLPDQCRRVLILRKVYGLSQQEVADQLGISISTVEKHLARGLQKCALRMYEQENPDTGEQASHTHQARRNRREAP